MSSQGVVEREGGGEAVEPYGDLREEEDEGDGSVVVAKDGDATPQLLDDFGQTLRLTGQDEG